MPWIYIQQPFFPRPWYKGISLQSFPKKDHLNGLDDTTPLIASLDEFYAQMDQEYEKTAQHYDFNCTGCNDNCCQTRFFHHTFLEYLYLKNGYDRLGDDKKMVIAEKARNVTRETEFLIKKDMPIRLMCPLNFKGACVLYTYRPMICRLHGIPHELQKPGAAIMKSPGCEEFTNRCPEKKYYRLDRTPFYIKLAEMENNLKQTTGITGRFKMTIAQMVLL
jgi:hypothetical protein